MKMNNKILSLLLVSSLAFATIGCKTSNALKGGAIGGAAGGVLGGLLSKNNTATGIIVGAAIGGSAGAIIGREMDKQAEELRRDLKGAKVERVGEGIKITFDSGLLFGFDQATLNSSSRGNLDKESVGVLREDSLSINRCQQRGECSSLWFHKELLPGCIILFLIQALNEHCRKLDGPEHPTRPSVLTRWEKLLALT